MTEQPPTLNERVERLLGIDARLFYGLFVPAAVIVTLVAGLALSPTWWLLVPLSIVLVGVTGVVVAGTLQMLGDDEDDQPRE